MTVTMMEQMMMMIMMIMVVRLKLNIHVSQKDINMCKATSSWLMVLQP